MLEFDPDLGAGIDAGEWEDAVAMGVAPEFTFERGRWEFSPRPERGGFGALILEGLIVIRIDAGGRSHIEMLGAGDVSAHGWERQLADIVAAQRPSVSTAVVRLEDHGRSERVARRTWLLRKPTPEMLTSLARQSGLEA